MGTIFNAYDTKRVKPVPYIIENMLGEKELLMVFGKSGSGKTYVVLDILSSLITGTPFAQQFNIDKPHHVLYCTAEGINTIPYRFRAIEQKLGVNFDENEYWTWYDDVPQLFNDNLPESTDAFIEKMIAAQIKIDVMVIDTLILAITGGNEDKSGDVTIVVNNLRKIINAFGCSIILVAHSNKGGSIERGSSGWRAAMDAVVQVNDKKIIASKFKRNGQWLEISFDFEKNNEDSYVIWQGNIIEKLSQDKQIMELLIQSTPKRFKSKELSQQLGIHEKTVSGILKRLSETNQISKELEKPDAKKSSSNPYLFFYDMM